MKWTSSASVDGASTLWDISAFTIRHKLNPVNSRVNKIGPEKYGTLATMQCYKIQNLTQFLNEHDIRIWRFITNAYQDIRKCKLDSNKPYFNISLSINDCRGETCFHCHKDTTSPGQRSVCPMNVKVVLDWKLVIHYIPWKSRFGT